MSIPPWLFDELADHFDDDELLARARAWARLLDGAAAARWQRDQRLQAQADLEHEAVWMAECRCVRARWSRDPRRCGTCVGLLPGGARHPTLPPAGWLGEAAPPRPPRPARRTMPTYDEVVAGFTMRPLASHCSCGACRAGRLPELPEGMAEAFANWKPYRPGEVI